MAVLERLARALGGVALALLLVGAGFGLCVLPPVTHGLANAFSDDVTSPFTRSQLVRVADATRDYAFGSHDEQALYRTIYEVDREYERSVEDSGGTVAKDFPSLRGLSPDAPATAYAVAFTHSSSVYCYTPDEVSHLDDCFAVAQGARGLLGAAALVAAAALVFLGVRCGRRAIGEVLMGAAIGVLGLFVLLGLWALVDFHGLFAAFHGLFFSQGNWTFPAESLLICALPTEFWVGMGIIWLAGTLGASILSLGIGFTLRKRARS